MLVQTDLIGRFVRGNPREQDPKVLESFASTLLCYLHRILDRLCQRLRWLLVDRYLGYAPLSKHIRHRYHGISSFADRMSLQRVSHRTTHGVVVLMIRGQIAANPFGAALSDRYGRRPAMFVGAAIIIVGMLIISTSSTVVQFAVGRFFLGFGIAISALAAPAYVVEISPPQWRGRATGLYNCGWFGGSM